MILRVLVRIALICHLKVQKYLCMTWLLNLRAALHSSSGASSAVLPDLHGAHEAAQLSPATAEEVFARGNLREGAAPRAPSAENHQAKGKGEEGKRSLPVLLR